MIKKTLDKLSISEIIKLFENLEIDEDGKVELRCTKDNFDRLGIKTFVELAQIFLYKIVDLSFKDVYIITLKKLDTNKSFHIQSADSEKYGVESEFFNINKNEEISFLYYFEKALQFVNISSRKSVLNIGVNKADEFLAIKEYLSAEEFEKKNFLGIDYSNSAIEYAKKQFMDFKNVKFLCADINKLEDISLGKFDLMISIGTLQSSNINFNAKFMELYQNHLEQDGAIILGFPNCRWIDGEMIYGAKAPNYSFNEMGLVLKDIHFCKKYLQQKGYRVVITGKDYLFLSARKISKN
ncbi:methyltransferase domain-containing protein [Sulfurimonas sp.]|uniref:methyltransferase domain-containing protein n=1 Tax=Sulfurimonas sp. TaxID=2022749 RepID=UPI0035677A18